MPPTQQKETTHTPTPRLCYVDGCWAYFTTQALDKQWGDDWNDAPYEHNAGEPYYFAAHDAEQGRVPWEIVRVAWSGDFETPRDGYTNSRWSVQDINAGAVAWLTGSRYRIGPRVVIPAGTTLRDFEALIAQGGGEVYYPQSAHASLVAALEEKTKLVEQLRIALSSSRPFAVYAAEGRGRFAMAASGAVRMVDAALIAADPDLPDELKSLAALSALKPAPATNAEQGD